MEKQIKLILIEDSPAYRSVIKRTLEGETDITLINQYGTAEIALRNLQDSSNDAPDVILLDLNLPGMNGLDALHWINEYTPKTKTIILTQSNQEADILHAISKGAAGYLLKSNTLDQLTEGIRTVMNGGATLDPTVASYIIGTMQKNTPSISRENPLSEREMEVLTLISEGLQKKEVAAQLKISPRTVAAHVEKIYEKLEVTNAPAAVNRAHQHGFFRG